MQRTTISSRAKAIIAAGIFCAGCAWGQTTTTNGLAAANDVTATIEAKAENPWSFSASVYTYIVPDSLTNRRLWSR